MTRPNLPRMLASALAVAMFFVPATARADMIDQALDQHILPGFTTLAQTSDSLARAAAQDCSPASAPLRTAYGAAFDAWVAVSHLRFGPTEADNRAFALAFWPDSRGKIPKTLNALIASRSMIAEDAEAYASVSIAARGFYALEFLLFDAGLQQPDTADYRCQLTRAITSDIAAIADAIWADWTDSYANQMRHPKERYKTETEVRQELFKALDTGLQILIDMRLGRPLGTFDRPRPKRAEAYRSGRSLRHVTLALAALEQLALILSMDDPELHDRLGRSFETLRDHAERLDDPVFAGVARAAPRLRVEALQQDIRNLRETVGLDLGPALGVEAGFNALDGD